MELIFINVFNGKKVLQGIMEIGGVNQYILVAVDAITNEIISASSQTIDVEGIINNTLIEDTELFEKIRKTFSL